MHYTFDEVPPLPGLLVERLSPVVALVRHGSSDARHNSIVSGYGQPRIVVTNTTQTAYEVTAYKVKLLTK